MLLLRAVTSQGRFQKRELGCRYLLTTNYVPRIVREAGDIAVDKTGRSSHREVDSISRNQPHE